MKYEIQKKHSVEVPAKELIRILQKEGIVPKDLKPERSIHSGTDVSLRVFSSTPGGQLLFIEWEERETRAPVKVAESKKKPKK